MTTADSADFFTAFQSARREIEDALQSSSPPGPDTVAQLQSLKADLTRHISSLPAYDQRSCTLQLNELEAKVSAARKQDKPKSRFAFARSTAAPATASSSSSISTRVTPTPNDTLTGGSGASASGTATASSRLSAFSASRSDTVPMSNSDDMSDSDDTTVRGTDVHSALLRLPSISTKVSISLSNISDSIVDLRTSQRVIASISVGPSVPGTPDLGGTDPVSAVSTTPVGSSAIPSPLRARDEWTRGISSLHVKGLKRCILIAGMEGSAILHGLEDCLVVVASHQFRIHSSHRTAILLHTLSVPVIEHSDSLYFGALPSHLYEESSGSRHDKVQDFDWVKGGPSPNWRSLGNTASEMLFPRDEADTIAGLGADEVEDVLERIIGSIEGLASMNSSA